MHVLVADAIAEPGLARLRAAGHRVVVSPDLSGDALRTALIDHAPQVLIVRSTRVTEEMLDGNPTLELIVRAGAGYNTIDVAAASDRGVFVSNCPGMNSAAVAELTIGLLISLDRRIPENVADAQEGRWNKARYAGAAGLRGRTLGVIGLGNVGTMVSKHALSLGMSVIAWSRSLTDARARDLGVRVAPNLLRIAEEADAVTWHVAATEETRGMADRSFFEHMTDGALFINTSRSSVVDESALRWALDEKGIRAALDVVSNEPPSKAGRFENPLAVHPSVYVTHHIGASTQQAQTATSEEVGRVITVYDETGHAPNCVNIEEHSPATHVLTVRHLDRVGVLAAVLDKISRAGWNVQEMENLIFSGAGAACARIRFDGDPRGDVLSLIEDHPDVLSVSMIELLKQ